VRRLSGLCLVFLHNPRHGYLGNVEHINLSQIDAEKRGVKTGEIVHSVPIEGIVSEALSVDVVLT